MEITKSFFEASMLLGDVHGRPLPKTVLSFGDMDKCWHITINNTDADLENHPKMSIMVHWGGFPAGLIEHDGGIIAAGSAANEETFLEWIDSERSKLTAIA
jgi:hypothetical protein